IEAMACGTPVVAFRRGAVPEIIDDGVSGWIADTVEEAVGALRRIDSLDRARVRQTFENRFTVERMCSDYVALYRALTNTGTATLAFDRDESMRRRARSAPPRLPAQAPKVHRTPPGP
ncbi:glycosyltransferase, partial [Mesorhizobium sp. M1428]